MSLIQEALKRQQEEFGDSAGKDGAPPPPGNGKPDQNGADAPPSPTPPPLPEPQAAGGNGGSSSKTRIFVTAGIIAAVLVLLVGLGAAVVLMLSRQVKPASIHVPPTRNAQVPKPKPLPKPEPAEPAEPAEPVVEELVVEDTPAQGEEEPEPEFLQETEPEPFRATAYAEEEPVEKKQPPLTWPAVRVSGLNYIAYDDQKSCAILNGKVMGIGEEINGVSIEAVQADGVMLKFKYETRFLQIGSSTR